MSLYPSLENDHIAMPDSWSTGVFYETRQISVADPRVELLVETIKVVSSSLNSGNMKHGRQDVSYSILHDLELPLLTRLDKRKT